MGWRKLSQLRLKLELQTNKNPKKLIGLDIGTQFTGISITCPSLVQTYVTDR